MGDVNKPAAAPLRWYEVAYGAITLLAALSLIALTVWPQKTGDIRSGSLKASGPGKPLEVYWRGPDIEDQGRWLRLRGMDLSDLPAGSTPDSVAAGVELVPVEGRERLRTVDCIYAGRGRHLVVLSDESAGFIKFPPPQAPPE